MYQKMQEDVPIEVVKIQVAPGHQLSEVLCIMFQNMQEDVPIEVVKILVAPPLRGFVHQFPNYSLFNIEEASKLCANKIFKNNFIHNNKPIYW